MNAHVGHEEMEAGWIDSSQGKLFVCYHPAKMGQARDCAVLLCDPFGSDRMNLHLTYRALAQRLANAGFSALRVDYPGTCDSSGYARDRALPSTWLRSLHDAADWLRARTGEPQLCAFGALLGGTFAIELAREREDVTGLVLWGAHPSGRAFLREIAAFRGMSTTDAGQLQPSGFQAGDQEALGFLITRASAAELAALEPLKSTGPIARHVAIYRRNRVYAVEPFAERLRDGGAEVYVQESALLDIGEIRESGTRPPGPFLDAMLTWWTATYPTPNIGGVPPQPESAMPSAKAHLSAGASVGDAAMTAPVAPTVSLASPGGEPVREEVLRFGPDRQIFGIVTTPPGGPVQGRVAVLLLNGGSNHRVGINRNYTEWARVWAARGLTVLRLDVRGLGDSPPRSPELLGRLYDDETVSDVRAAMDFLEGYCGARGFLCLGLCAGGYQGLHTALSDPRVQGLVMLNPLRFQRAQAGDDTKREFHYKATAQYLRSALSLETWRKLSRGDGDLRGVVRWVGGRLLQRARAEARKAMARGQAVSPPPANWLSGAFRQLCERGCHVLLVFSATDGIVEAFQEELAAERPRLDASGRLQIEIIENTDHIFRPLWSQEHVGQLVTQSLLTWAR